MSSILHRFPFEVLVHVFRERFSNLPDADYPEMKSVEPTKYEEFEGGQVRKWHNWHCWARRDNDTVIRLLLKSLQLGDCANADLHSRPENPCGSHPLRVRGRYST